MDSAPGSKQRDLPPPHHDTSTADMPASHSQAQLLPPLELLPSSPGLPSASSARQDRSGSAPKRPSGVANHSSLNYPTPLPTSSTGILSSSPPRVSTQPSLQHVPGTVAERAPLSAVPSIELDENGDTLLFGRSSSSSHYQLSANRLISRVHVKARYVAATAPLQANKLEIECSGWNGLKLHCQGRSYDMRRGEVLAFETEGVDVMLDVQDARVLVHWPKRDARDGLACLGWDDSPCSPPDRGSPIGAGAASPSLGAAAGLGLLQPSPMCRPTCISSPESPTPAHASSQQAVSAGGPTSSQQSDILSDLPSISDRERSVDIYEDEDGDQQDSSFGAGSISGQTLATSVGELLSSHPSEPSSDDDYEKNPNQENDPIVHSFGPCGGSLKRRLSTSSFRIESPKRRRLDSGEYSAKSPTVETAPAGNQDTHPSSTSVSTPREASISRKASVTPPPKLHINETEQSKEAGPDLNHLDVVTITDHVVNQLAFSRLSSTPLSTILSNLPAEKKKDLLSHQLRYIVDTTTCIGIIERQGKDANGKPLESQYYYIPEYDHDEHRRAAVVDGLRKPTLRNCRKHHVQYYWKRPRTP